MKKLLVLFTIITALCSLVSCGNSTSPSYETTYTTNTTTAENTETTTSKTSFAMCLYDYTKLSPYAISWGESAYAFRNYSWSLSTDAISYSEIIDSAEKMPISNNIRENEKAEAIFSRFDGEFFKAHSLLYIHLNFSSGSIYPENIYMTKNADGSCDIDIVTYIPEIQTCDMATWTMIIVLDKSDSENTPAINVSVR